MPAAVFAAAGRMTAPAAAMVERALRHEFLACIDSVCLSKSGSGSEKGGNDGDFHVDGLLGKGG